MVVGWVVYFFQTVYMCTQESCHPDHVAITLSFVDRSAKFFQCSKENEISNTPILRYPPHLKSVVALP